ncbi:hypothetical protein LTR78_005248 [Recurvomyces mirabilis]|uniref:MARVEL domain-containing protein n=1 Tax=Recurvomyces mirabilis TaxID=574656 RepID=A0AAE0WN67_9PEZI|nr:hypothetical protein LTR78_005248 [Recurvomyces mirabilis]KAK5157798.1 hypothetical protein LTS14_003720 [Recurvomyces mirabilis]
MALSGFLFLSWRIFEIIILIPIVGMLAYFVHQYVHANLLTPDYILVLFIVSVIALAWAVFTTIDYLRARHDALFVGLFDLGLVGALIAGVYYLRNIAHQNCTNLDAGFNNGSGYLSFSANKACTMLKASFALAIIAILAFFVTFSLEITAMTIVWSSSANIVHPRATIAGTVLAAVMFAEAVMVGTTGHLAPDEATTAAGGNIMCKQGRR